MVQIDVPAASVVSQLLLDIGRKTVQAEAGQSKETDGKPAVYYRFLFRSVFFAGVAIVPAGIYLLAGWPGWEQLYWTERVENVIFQWLNALYPAMFVVAIVGAGYLGHIIGYRWLVTGQVRRSTSDPPTSVSLSRSRSWCFPIIPRIWLSGPTRSTIPIQRVCRTPGQIHTASAPAG